MHDIATKVTSPQLTKSAHQTWVQTEREAHEAWGHLIIESPRAAALMHHLVANMDQSAAVVASHGTLSEICGFSVATVKRAISDLVKTNGFRSSSSGVKALRVPTWSIAALRGLHRVTSGICRPSALGCCLALRNRIKRR